MSEVKQFFKHVTMQVVAGGSAGFVEIAIMFPLDVVKTRLQMQSSRLGDPGHYRGVLDCINKTLKSEGFFALWKGVLPPLLAETPIRAAKFLTFEQCKRVFMFGSQSPTPLTYSLAGLIAGIAEGLLVNPFEVVKVTLQANRDKVQVTPSTWSVTKEIVREYGFGSQGLNKGLTATLGRHAVFNAVYLSFYYSSKDFFPKLQDSVQEFLRQVSIGFASGTLGSMCNIPFDVAKSRIQGPQPVPGQIKYRTTISTMILVCREEGWRALYKGLVPKVMRLGPGGAIILVIYDNVYHMLQNKFPD